VEENKEPDTGRQGYRERRERERERERERIDLHVSLGFFSDKAIIKIPTSYCLANLHIPHAVLFEAG
jgi:hypothetical protein